MRGWINLNTMRTSVIGLSSLPCAALISEPATWQISYSVSTLRFSFQHVTRQIFIPCNYLNWILIVWYYKSQHTHTQTRLICKYRLVFVWFVRGSSVFIAIWIIHIVITGKLVTESNRSSWKSTRISKQFVLKKKQSYFLWFILFR